MVKNDGPRGRQDRLCSELNRSEAGVPALVLSSCGTEPLVLTVFARPKSTSFSVASSLCFSNFCSNFRLILVNFERLVLGGGGRPDYLQKLKVPEGYEKMFDYSNRLSCIEAKLCK